MLQAHPDIHPETILVYLDSINVNSLDILVHFYTNTTKSTEYSGVKEDVNYRIMDILAGENISLATPGRTIYSENIPAGKNTGGSSPR
jgi:MscS family membrane protein